MGSNRLPLAQMHPFTANIFRTFRAITTLSRQMVSLYSTLKLNGRLISYF